MLLVQKTLLVDVKSRMALVGDVHIREGDLITIDGSTGDIYLGRIPTIEPTFSKELKNFASVGQMKLQKLRFTPTQTHLIVQNRLPVTERQG